MSLLQLLSVGQSFLSIEDRPSPYRMTQQNLLPKFGPAREDHADQDLGHQISQPSVMPTRPAEERGRAATVKDSAKKMTAIEAYSQIGSAASLGGAATGPQPYPAGRWNMIRNPFQRRSAPQKGATLVQGELSLAAVRPVRNDLNDADLEVVPCREAPGKQRHEVVLGTELLPASEPPVATRFLWSRLRQRLLKRA